MYLTLSAIVVGSLAQTNPASTPVALDSLCTGLDNSYACAQTLEAHQLASADMARVATRTPAGLHLRLANGKTLTVKNTGHADDGSVVRFSFRDYLKGIGCFLLHRPSSSDARRRGPFIPTIDRSESVLRFGPCCDAPYSCSSV